MPSDWKTSIVLSLFKKGDNKILGNYRGINLLNTTLKVMTKVFPPQYYNVLTLKMNSRGLEIEGLALFVIQKITEKSGEFQKSVFMSDRPQ